MNSQSSGKLQQTLAKCIKTTFFMYSNRKTEKGMEESLRAKNMNAIIQMET